MNEPVTIRDSTGMTDMSLDLETLLTLEQRVQQLEQTVVALQDTQVIEDRIVARLSTRALPAAQQQYTAQPPPAPAPPPSPLPEYAFAPTPVKVAAQAWLVVEMWRDFKSIFLMFFDVHYHVAWITRAVLIVLLPAILTVDWWMPLSYLPVIGPIVGGVVAKILGLFLAFFLFKFLTREAQRYQESHRRW